MIDQLGDIRSAEQPNLDLVWHSLDTLGYVVTSDTAPLGLDTTFRTDTLPAHQPYLVADIHGVRPRNRIGARGLVDYEWQPDGSVQLTQDHRNVAIPTKSYHEGPRIYPDGLPIVNNPLFSRWLRGVITFIPSAQRHQSGSVHVNYFETGGYGDDEDLVVEGPHQDDEEWVVSFVEKASDDGAVTTLSRKEVGSNDQEARHIQVASFRLAAGDLALSDDINLWHDVSRAKGRRRALILVFNKPDTHAWLQDFYAKQANELN